MRENDWRIRTIPLKPSGLHNEWRITGDSFDHPKEWAGVAVQDVSRGVHALQRKSPKLIKTHDSHPRMWDVLRPMTQAETAREVMYCLRGNGRFPGQDNTDHGGSVDLDISSEAVQEGKEVIRCGKAKLP